MVPGRPGGGWGTAAAATWAAAGAGVMAATAVGATAALAAAAGIGVKAATAAAAAWWRLGPCRRGASRRSSGAVRVELVVVSHQSAGE